MATEIEHKYLVKDDSYREQVVQSYHITQGYLCREHVRTVRVRLRDESGFITIKGAGNDVARPEFEYEIPAADARELLKMCEPPLLEKTRHIVEYQGNRWEVDEFHGRLQGLTLAELEIPSEDYQYDRPLWVGEDVTGDPRYHNSNL